MIPIFKPNLGSEELSQISESFSTGWIGLGPKTKQFEQDFKTFIGSREAISLNSCTAALHLALLASGVKKGDEVLVPALTFASTAHVVIFCGAIPILVDVKADTLLMDVNDMRRKITPKTKAVIPVHYGGMICDMDSIISLAKEHNLVVIEDAANCTGAKYKSKRIGNLESDFTCFSFEAKKNMTTEIRSLRWVGMDKDTHKRFSGQQNPWEYDIIALGYKYNMNDIAAGIGIAQLKKLEDMNNKRNSIVELYNSSLSNIKWLQTPVSKEDASPAYWLYVLRVDVNRDELMKHLFSKEILANTNFKPLHFFSYYKEYYRTNNIKVDCPIAEQEWKKIVVLPLYPDMVPKNIRKVIKVIEEYQN